MLKGLAEAESVLQASGIPFYLVTGDPVSQISSCIDADAYIRKVWELS